MSRAHPTRRLNVLHTVHSLRIDGVVKVLARNMAHRDPAGFNHHVCALRDEDELAGEFLVHGIRPFFMGHAGPPSVARTMHRLGKLIRELDIDVVHANRTIDLALAGAVAKARGIPVVSTIHWLGRMEEHPEDALELSRMRRWSEMRATVLLNRWLATRIVAVSEAVRASYASLAGFPSERTEVVYPGIDLQAPAPSDAGAAAALKARLGLASAKPVLLNIGRLHPVKGQLHLVPMMQRLRRRLPGAQLLIAGEGELRPRLAQAIAAAGLQGSIVLLGARNDIDALLAVSDVLVLASESEAAGLPLFEAMRAGKPVVATAVGGVPEIVEDGKTGYLVPRADPHAMADAVLRLAEKPYELKRMGEAALRCVRERFDVAQSMRALESMYKALAVAVPGTQALARGVNR